VAGYIDAGKAAGATLVVDGRAGKFDADGNEFFIGPTLFDEVRTDMSSYSDEIFRPVLSVFRIDTYEEAVKLIYATPTATGPRSSPTTAARRPGCSEQTIDNISCRQTPCSRFAPVSVHTPRIVDHQNINIEVDSPALTCEDSPRVNLTARVELRGFEPLTL
jgi:hypothetical protein